MEHAVAILHVKSFDSTSRTFSGIATTPELDRQGHKVDPAGITYANPLPLLWQHGRDAPIGTATLGIPTDEGTPFEASIPFVQEAGRLKDRCDEAIQCLTYGLIKGVSIGFRIVGSLKDAIKPLKDGTFLFKAIEILELSLVTIPANQRATIRAIQKSAASSGNLPGDSGLPTRTAMPETIREQITTWENKRAATVARMDVLMSKAAEKSETLDDESSKEYDELETTLGDVDKHLVRLHTREKADIAMATAIAPVTNQNDASKLRSGVVTVKPNVPVGTVFTRMVMAKLQSQGDSFRALEIAKQWKDSTPEVEIMIKAAVAPGTTTDPAWAGALAVTQNATAEFIGLLRPATLLGKIPALRMVPFNVSVPVQTSGGVYNWVGQGMPKPLTKLGLATVVLGINKAAGIITFTKELARTSSPSAEEVIRRDMIAGIAQFLDAQFILPGNAPVAGVNPGSITNGVTPIASTDNPLADIHALVSKFSTANMPVAGSVLIMSETNALTMGMIRDPNGNRLFPSVTATGGTAEGITIVTSNQAADNIILIQPSYILLADDGQVEIDVSQEASVQMADTPMYPADATTILTSLWQNNLIGVRAERFITWKRGLDAAVAIATGATYAPAYIPPA